MTLSASRVAGEIALATVLGLAALIVLTWPILPAALFALSWQLLALASS